MAMALLTQQHPHSPASSHLHTASHLPSSCLSTHTFPLTPFATYGKYLPPLPYPTFTPLHYLARSTSGHGSDAGVSRRWKVTCPLSVMLYMAAAST